MAREFRIITIDCEREIPSLFSTDGWKEAESLFERRSRYWMLSSASR
jgi:hypothetical protein